MLKFIIIGMMCNIQNCYWAEASSKPMIYNDLAQCKADADKLKKNSIMYFLTDCIVYDKG